MGKYCLQGTLACSVRVHFISFHSIQTADFICFIVVGLWEILVVQVMARLWKECGPIRMIRVMLVLSRTKPSMVCQ